MLLLGGEELRLSVQVVEGEVTDLGGFARDWKGDLMRRNGRGRSRRGLRLLRISAGVCEEESGCWATVGESFVVSAEEKRSGCWP